MLFSSKNVSIIFSTLHMSRLPRIQKISRNITFTSRAYTHTINKMRLPDAPSTPPANNPEVAGIYERISARRAPRPLTPLDLALLHSPHIADGWNSFLGAVRTKSTLDDLTREIAICRVAVLNGAAYEWGHHAPLALKAGLKEEDLVRLAEKEPKIGEGTGISEKMWLVVRYSDAMTRDVHVEDALFQEISKVFNEREVVELTATVAAYNCVSRFLVALDVGEANGKQITAEGIKPH